MFFLAQRQIFLPCRVYIETKQKRGLNFDQHKCTVLTTHQTGGLPIFLFWFQKQYIKMFLFTDRLHNKDAI